MDRDLFDGLTRLLASSPNRRAALGALLGTGLAGSLGAAAAAKQGRKHRRGGTRGKAQVSAQAAPDCANPGHGANISGCDYTDDDFSGQDLSSSRMVGTIFRRADLVGTDLSSSNARNAVFREADLSCADLRSSTLGGANFRDTDLTLANLKSSGGCNSATFTAGTTFCGTVMCDGSVRNDDCVGGPPAGACCGGTLCGEGEACINNACVPAECPNPTENCIFGNECGPRCVCDITVGGGATCNIFDAARCAVCGDCLPNERCVVLTGCCSQGTACVPACADLAPNGRRAAGGSRFGG